MGNISHTFHSEQNTKLAGEVLPLTLSSAVDTFGPRRGIALSLEHVLNRGYHIKYKVIVDGLEEATFNKEPITSEIDAWKEYVRVKAALENNQYELSLEENTPHLRITRDYGGMNMTEAVRIYLETGRFSQLTDAMDRQAAEAIDSKIAKIEKILYDSMRIK